MPLCAHLGLANNSMFYYRLIIFIITTMKTITHITNLPFPTPFHCQPNDNTVANIRSSTSGGNLMLMR